MVEIRYSRPESLQEALEELARNGQSTLWAGGTDLIIRHDNKRVKVSNVLDLKGILELDFIGEGDPVRIGALTSIHRIDTSPVVRREFPFLAQAAHVLGSWQIRTLATLGGNLVNAAPSAETATPILAIEGTMVAVGPQGRRRIPAKDFFTGPGQTALHSGEILCEVELPRLADGFRTIYLKHSLRRSMDIALASVAGAVRMDGNRCVEARIGLGAVAPVPLRVVQAERLLSGQVLSPELIAEAAAVAAAECRPIDDIRATAGYRRDMIQVLVKRALTSLVKEGEKE